jgi:hypothetical protein
MNGVRTLPTAAGGPASRRTAWVIAGGLLFVLTASSCVGAAKSFDVYEAKATHSVQQALSALETVRAAMDQAAADRSFGPTLSSTMHDAEEDVSTAQGHFESIQPPDARSDALRSEAGDLLSRAADDVQRARISMRRGDLRALLGLRRELDRLSQTLNRFVERHL